MKIQLKNKLNGFTLIELLVVVAIIGILAAVGVVAYNGYTSSAKRATSIANWKSVSKYISNQVMKCSIGESKAMDGNLDCSKQGANNWDDVVINATVLALTDFKNPWNSTGSPITGGGQYWYDKDVGYIRIMSHSKTQVEVWVCAITPCGSKPNPNVYDNLVTIYGM